MSTPTTDSIAPSLPSWAIIQLGYAVIGEGETQDEAIKAACEWSDCEASELEIVDIRNAVDGSCVLTNDAELIAEYI